MPITSKKFVKKRNWLQNTNKSCAEHKNSLHKNARFLKGVFVYYASISVLALLLSRYVLDSFSGVPQVQMFFGDYCLNLPQVQNCLFFLAITVGGATKGCATRLGNSRATNRIYLLNNNKYT